MKTIKRISHLQLEKKRLARRKARLEDDIRSDWTGIKHTFEPSNFARGAIFSGLSWVGHRFFPTEPGQHNKHSS